MFSTNGSNFRPLAGVLGAISTIILVGCLIYGYTYWSDSMLFRVVWWLVWFGVLPGILIFTFRTLMKKQREKKPKDASSGPRPEDHA